MIVVAIKPEKSLPGLKRLLLDHIRITLPRTLPLYYLHITKTCWDKTINPRCAPFEILQSKFYNTTHKIYYSTCRNVY